jgi:hypothetical protein
MTHLSLKWVWIQINVTFRFASAEIHEINNDANEMASFAAGDH